MWEVPAKACKLLVPPSGFFVWSSLLPPAQPALPCPGGLKEELTASPLSAAWEEPAGGSIAQVRAPPPPLGASRVSWLQPELRRGLE